MKDNIPDLDEINNVEELVFGYKQTSDNPIESFLPGKDDIDQKTRLTESQIEGIAVSRAYFQAIEQNPYHVDFGEIYNNMVKNMMKLLISLDGQGREDFKDVLTKNRSDKVLEDLAEQEQSKSIMEKFKS